MEENELKLTGKDKDNFLETAKWGKFLAIVGFILSGLMIVAGLSMMTGSFADIPVQFGAFGFIYILLSLLYVFPSLYLFRFSTQIKQGINEKNQELCSEAYNNLRRLFLFMGVMTIVVLSFYALALLFALMGGFMGGMF
ncbi:DUF5362 family protein [Ekhidna sp.]